MSHRKYGLDHLGCRTARRLVSPALALWLCSQPFAARADLYFNPRFLADDPAAVADLSGFEKGQEVPPGTYRVDIYLNNGFMTTRDVTFQADAQGHGLSPCLTRGQLASMGVDTGRVPGMATLDMLYLTHSMPVTGLKVLMKLRNTIFTTESFNMILKNSVSLLIWYRQYILSRVLCYRIYYRSLRKWMVKQKIT